MRLHKKLCQKKISNTVHGDVLEFGGGDGIHGGEASKEQQDLDDLRRMLRCLYLLKIETVSVKCIRESDATPNGANIGLLIMRPSIL